MCAIHGIMYGICIGCACYDTYVNIVSCIDYSVSNILFSMSLLISGQAT